MGVVLYEGIFGHPYFWVKNEGGGLKKSQKMAQKDEKTNKKRKK
jgi:hypothetical protein